MGYRHPTIDDRSKIEVLLKEGHPAKKNKLNI